MFTPKSPETLVLLACVATASMVGAARLAKRKSGSLARATGTVLTLGLASVSVAVAGGVGANMGFTYAHTWRDAAEIVAGHQFGPDLEVTEKPAPSYRGRIPALPTPTGPEWRAKFTPQRDGTWGTTFTGPKSGIRRQVRVWLPPGYSAAQPHRVLVMLHGYPGNPNAIPRQLKLRETMPATAPDTIVVVPYLLPDHASPDGIDIAGRPKVGTWVVDDVVGLVRANFATSDLRDDWAIGGASYGGWLAATLGLLHPDRFGTIIAFSGYDRATTGALTRDRSQVDEYSVPNLLAAATWPQRIYATATAPDAGATALVADLRRTENPMLDIATRVEPRGKHGWATWARQLPAAMRWWTTGERPDPGVEVSGASNAVPIGATVALSAVTLAAGGALVVRGRRWGAGRRGTLAALTGVLGGGALLALFVALHGMP